MSKQVDMSDEDFEVLVTHQYDGKKFASVTAFIRHRASGRWENPQIAARDLNAVGDVIRDFKERLAEADRRSADEAR